MADDRPCQRRAEERTCYEETADLERTVDEMEERVLGHRHDQVREQSADEEVGAEPP